MGASASCVRGRRGGRTTTPSARSNSSKPTPPQPASTVVAVTSSGHHILKIPDYSLIKEIIPTGESIESGSFIVGGHSWHIDYCPNGECPEHADWVAVFLALDDDAGEPVKAQFSIIFVGDTNNPYASHIRATQVFDFQLEKCWGYPMLVKKEDLERATCLVDNCLTIRCDVVVISGLRTEKTEIIADAATSVPKSFVVAPPADLQQHLANLLSSNELGADVTFEVGGETFVAHRNILAARSSVFKAELFGGMRESTATNAIPIKDMEARVFKALLHFIYTDSFPETTEGEEYAMAQHLLVAADMYDLQRLKLICEEKLCEYIDINTVASILTLAEERHCDGLKQACLEFLNTPANLRAVMATTDGFEILGCPSVVKELIDKLAPP